MRHVRTDRSRAAAALIEPLTDLVIRAGAPSSPSTVAP
jgi:hypothetical protein